MVLGEIHRSLNGREDTISSCAAGGRGGGKVRREVGRRLLIVLGLKEDEHYLGFSQETRI